VGWTFCSTHSASEHIAFDPASGLRLAVMAAAAAAAGVALWLLVGGLAHMALTAGHLRTARQLGWLRWLVPGSWVAPYLVVIAAAVATSDSFDPVWNGGLEYAVFAGLVPFAWLAVLLLQENGKAWTFPPGTVHERSPWAQRRAQHNAPRRDP
jgi:hypothetical protein